MQRCVMLAIAATCLGSCDVADSDSDSDTDTGSSWEIDFAAPGPCRAEFDGDYYYYPSSIDGIPDRVTTWTYDAQGREITTETDYEADDVVDLKEIKTWSVDSLLLLHEFDEGADDTVERWYEFTYDEACRLLQEDHFEGGYLESSDRYFFDDQGLLVGEDHYEDGILGLNLEYLYDSDHRLIWEDRYDGEVLVLSEEYSYDADDRLLQQTTHIDGEIDAVVDHSYDDDGNLEMTETDGPGGIDGVPDERMTYFYNGDGLLGQKQLDYEADGTPDEYWTYSYDEAGRLVGEGHSGSTFSGSRSWSYDEWGYLATNGFNDNYNWNEGLTTYTHDQWGNRHKLHYEHSSLFGCGEKQTIYFFDCWQEE